MQQSKDNEFPVCYESTTIIKFNRMKYNVFYSRELPIMEWGFYTCIGQRQSDNISYRECISFSMLHNLIGH